MANYATHLKAGIIASAGLSSLTLATGISNLPQSLALFVIGALSGLLPDLDADDSTSINRLFAMFGLAIAAAVILLLPLYSMLEIWGAGILTYGLVVWVIKPGFEALTVHRASMHSLLGVLVFVMLAISLGIAIGLSLNMALLCGVFVGVGSLVHLILDECYSVDLDNRQLKRSFGTALVPMDIRYPLACAAQVLCVLGAGYYLFPHWPEMQKVGLWWWEKASGLRFFPVYLHLS